MNNSYGIAMVLITLLLAAVPGHAQLPRDPQERAKVIAQIMSANASQLTIFDRQGKVLSTVGERDLYNQPALSPDGKRLAVIKADLGLDKENNDLWIFDVATGKGTQLTFSKSREGANAPTWSPDGTRLAYVALRDGYFGVYQRPVTGDGAAGAAGAEELLYKHSGAPITLTQWTLDGRYLIFSSNDLSGGILYALPLTGERKPIQFLHSKWQVRTPRVSPDNRFVAFPSNESGKVEMYVRPFDPSQNAEDEKGGKWQVSDGSLGMAFWRADGKELYYLGADRSIMAVEVSTTPEFKFEKPKVLFRPSEATPINPGTASFTGDGDRIVIAIPPPQLRQLTMFDREGKVVSRFGPPGLYLQPGLSPDGKHVVVMRTDPQTSNVDIWTYDIATGKGYAVTNDTPPENAPVWSPDGTQVAYVSTREQYAGIYRKAWDGTGEEELLFRYTPGAGMVLTDWSPDGKFMTFYTGVLLLVPLRPDDKAEKALDRKAIEWLREDYDVVQGRFSPDGRFLAFLSNEATVDKLEVYVRPFDPGKPEAPAGPAVRVSKNGAIGMVFWRQDGKEMYFMTRDWEVMAVDITTSPSFQAGTPRLLFKLPGPLPGNPAQWKNVSPDGQRFVFAMPLTAR
jgi:Tol biopolymer transport system component